MVMQLTAACENNLHKLGAGKINGYKMVMFNRFLTRHELFVKILGEVILHTSLITYESNFAYLFYTFIGL